MEINTVNPRDFQVIQGYGDGGFRISGQRHEGAVLVLPSRTLAWSVADLGQVTPESLSALADERPAIEVLLLGTGARTQAIAPSLRRALGELYGLGVEVMDSGAACRTYNVLVAELRPVAAALLVTGI